ncbi:MAG: hypothetical protein U0894_10655 [Pirellulales bacterium]
MDAARKGWVEQLSGMKKGEASRWKLTVPGEGAACRAAREYRLWQAFLENYPQESASVAHLSGQTVGEAISPAIALSMQQALVAQGRWPSVNIADNGSSMLGAV